MSGLVVPIPNLKYRIGDLFANLPADLPVVIPHVCNDVYVMGSGFVVPLKRRWPGVEKKYMTEKPALGTVQFVEVQEHLWVANMVAQRSTVRPDNPKPIKYLQLAQCMDVVGNHAKEHGAEIHCPLFGAGLAGGNWDFIEELICELWCCGRDLRVFVHQLPGETLRDASEK